MKSLQAVAAVPVIMLDSPSPHTHNILFVCCKLFDGFDVLLVK